MPRVFTDARVYDHYKDIEAVKNHRKASLSANLVALALKEGVFASLRSKFAIVRAEDARALPEVLKERRNRHAWERRWGLADD
jgi:hypothetical protein